MTKDAIILCAVDLGPLTGRVIFHAAGMARVTGLPLKVLHAVKQGSPTIESEVTEACVKAAPYGLPLDGLDVVVRLGAAADVIAREAAAHNVAMLVMGTGSHSGLISLLVGSTSAIVLEQTRVPVLLVPPTQMDLVTYGDRVALTCGAVLAAVDLTEATDRQVKMASLIASLAGAPLLLLTVVDDKISDSDASEQLGARARLDLPVKPSAVIVRRGDITHEISSCAAVEGAGLVVMGLRDRLRGHPGRTAASLLKTGGAFVLAVPN